MRSAATMIPPRYETLGGTEARRGQATAAERSPGNTNTGDRQMANTYWQGSEQDLHTVAGGYMGGGLFGVYRPGESMSSGTTVPPTVVRITGQQGVMDVDADEFFARVAALIDEQNRLYGWSPPQKPTRQGLSDLL
jgi:hypothetical protein